MHIVFLGSRLPLTKTYVAEAGVIKAAPYPLVSKVTSYHEQFETLAELRDLLVDHATQNHCLFNGQLKRPLVHESRASQTLPSPREWVVFDFDGVEANDHKEVVAKYLPAECQNVSYIAQLSSSMFRPDNTHWSGHIFMLLKEPIESRRLRQWFEHLNFTQPALKDLLRLSDSLQALHWPLDRTVAYDSKLIYIASPKCYGFTPAINQHITLVNKRQQRLSIPEFTPIDSMTIRQKINELRAEIGEAPIEYNTTQYEGHELLKQTDVCQIHGIRASGDHYIRFNMNGGDSYAYFIDLRNPEVIRNFKSEPYLLTKDAAPELYKALRKSAPSIVAKPPLEEGCEVLAFYATNQNSRLKIGVFDPVNQTLELNNATENAARAWLYSYGMFQREPFDHKYLVFDPQSDVQYLPNSITVNTFVPTSYMAKPKTSEVPTTLKDLPPVVNKIIRSALGPCEEEVVAAFVNWIAFIFQKRTKTQTAWVLSGVEGTGKNALVKYYLAPILGQRHVQSVQYANLNKEYNGFLENALLVVVEEADLRAADNQEDAMSKLKNWITDSPLLIRKMNTDHMMMENYSNFLLLSNTQTVVQVTRTDRRFNFGERQTQRWIPTPNELQVFTSGAELEAFADFLRRWPVDEVAVTRVVETQARRDAHEATTPINQLIAEAILTGDLQFLIDRMPSDNEAMGDFGSNRFNPLGLYKQLIDRFTAAAESGTPVLLKDEDLFVIFRTLVPDPRFFQDSKVWRNRHYKSLGLDVSKRHRVPGNWDKREYGVLVNWRLPEGAALPAPAPEKVTPIAKKRKRG